MTIPGSSRFPAVLLIVAADAFVTPVYAGFADPVVPNQTATPGGHGATLLDLRGYCSKRYGNRYYAHNFSCWSGYANDPPTTIKPDQACKDLYGDSYRSTKQNTDLYCVSSG